MKIYYVNEKVERYCTDARAAQREFNKLVAEKLLYTIDIINRSKNLKSVIDRASLHFHKIDRQGRWRNIYSIYLGKKLGFRLMVRPLNADGSPCTDAQIYSAAAVEIVDILVEGVTNHYE